MSGEQLEFSFMLAAGCFVTLAGFGRINIGLPRRNQRMMRWAGPLLVVASGLLLASTFVR
jgi:hypothetical protein